MVVAPPAFAASTLPPHSLEYACEFTIIHPVTGAVINVPVVVDSGFMGELELESPDVKRLGLGDPVTTQVLVLADYVTETTVGIFEPVLVQLRLSDGTTVGSLIRPSVALLEDSTSPIPHAAADLSVSTKRLLGYEGLKLLGLKLDAKHDKLVRRVLRK